MPHPDRMTSEPSRGQNPHNRQESPMTTRILDHNAFELMAYSS